MRSSGLAKASRFLHTQKAPPLWPAAELGVRFYEVNFGISLYKTYSLALLWGRTGGSCSICKVNLLKEFPKSGNVNLGERAHIIPHSKKGPRGNGKSEGENNYENLILLCGYHHTGVDKAVKDYPSSKLLEIKKDHEATVRSSIDSVGQNEMISSILTHIKIEGEPKIVPVLLAEGGSHHSYSGVVPKFIQKIFDGSFGHHKIGVDLKNVGAKNTQIIVYGDVSLTNSPKSDTKKSSSILAPEEIVFKDILKKILAKEICSNLTNSRIDSKEHIKSVKKFIIQDSGLRGYSNKFNKFCEEELKHLHLPENYDWLKKEGVLTQECEEKLKNKKIIVALAPILMGGSAVFYHLRESGYKIDIQNGFIHAADIIEGINEINPDIVLGADGMLAQLNKNREIRKEYVTWICLNYFELSTVIPKTRVNGFVSKKIFDGKIVFHHDEGSPNGHSVTMLRHKEQGNLKFISSSIHKKPHEVLECLYSEPDLESNYLLSPLQTNFALELGLGTKFWLNSKVPVVIVANKSFIKSKEGECFRVAIKNAWDSLLISETLRKRAIKNMVDDKDFFNVMMTLSGYKGFLKEKSRV